MLTRYLLSGISRLQYEEKDVTKEQKRSPLCIYHNADLDGHASGAVVKMAHRNAEMFGMDYGDEMDWQRVHGRKVIVVDFSLQPWSEMEKLLDSAWDVIWVDHHKSAIEEWKKAGAPFVRGSRVDGVAACELAWKVWYPQLAVPEAIKLLGDYDVWKFQYNDTKDFQYGMRSRHTDPSDTEGIQLWETLFSNRVSEIHEQLIQEGKAILRYEKQKNVGIAKKLCGEVDFGDWRWLVANVPFVNSEFFQSVKDDEIYIGYIAYVRIGGRWRVSLYSENVDCSKIAKEHGGGGHKGAAGFVCDKLPW